uniref:Cupin domain-containing protein n=1 Tax=Roseihalotalea indica TaxID=2867963 RepID=A0AA49JJD5_9BACT|nr:cupin domain-containing protein [Tunicatimonas sp. TK19036]
MADISQYIQEVQAEPHLLQDDGTFPNNQKLPLIIYSQVLDLSEGDAASIMESVLQANGWGNSWRNGIYTYHHYHSTAHEFIGIYRGKVKVELGGPDVGIEVEAKAGDVIVIPAGVVHKNLGASADFACIGAYPPGQNFDMNYGKESERPQADENIKQVPLPNTDPVYGNRGMLLKLWKD